MKRYKTGICILFTLVGVLAAAPLAHAEATRTWVSGVGDDANPCSRTAPCKTFAGAISKTATGGEIDALDPGGYGAVTITKAITIAGTGTNASVLVSGSPGITINAPSDAVVHLRNISLNGVGTGTVGVNFLAGKALYASNVGIWNFAGPGFKISNLATAGRVVIDHSSVHNTTAGLSMTQATAALSRVSVSHSVFSLNNTGVAVSGANARMTLRDVVLSGNVNAGLYATASGTALVESSEIENNGTGILADASGLLFVSNCDIMDNAIGVAASGGARILSRLNNNLDNVNNGAFTGSYSPA